MALIDKIRESLEVTINANHFNKDDPNTPFPINIAHKPKEYDFATDFTYEEKRQLVDQFGYDINPIVSIPGFDPAQPDAANVLPVQTKIYFNSPLLDQGPIDIEVLAKDYEEEFTTWLTELNQPYDPLNQTGFSASRNIGNYSFEYGSDFASVVIPEVLNRVVNNFEPYVIIGVVPDSNNQDQYIYEINPTWAEYAGSIQPVVNTKPVGSRHAVYNLDSIFWYLMLRYDPNSPVQKVLTNVNQNYSSTDQEVIETIFSDNSIFNTTTANDLDVFKFYQEQLDTEAGLNLPSQNPYITNEDRRLRNYWEALNLFVPKIDAPGYCEITDGATLIATRLTRQLLTGQPPNIIGYLGPAEAESIISNYAARDEGITNQNLERLLTEIFANNTNVFNDDDLNLFDTFNLNFVQPKQYGRYGIDSYHQYVDIDQYIQRLITNVAVNTATSPGVRLDLALREDNEPAVNKLTLFQGGLAINEGFATDGFTTPEWDPHIGRSMDFNYATDQVTAVGYWYDRFPDIFTIPAFRKPSPFYFANLQIDFDGLEEVPTVPSVNNQLTGNNSGDIIYGDGFFELPEPTKPITNMFIPDNDTIGITEVKHSLVYSEVANEGVSANTALDETGYPSTNYYSFLRVPFQPAPVNPLAGTGVGEGTFGGITSDTYNWGNYISAADNLEFWNGLKISNDLQAQPGYAPVYDSMPLYFNEAGVNQILDYDTDADEYYGSDYPDNDVRHAPLGYESLDGISLRSYNLDKGPVPSSRPVNEIITKSDFTHTYGYSSLNDSWNVVWDHFMTHLVLLLKQNNAMKVIIDPPGLDQYEVVLNETSPALLQTNNMVGGNLVVDLQVSETILAGVLDTNVSLLQTPNSHRIEENRIPIPSNRLINISANPILRSDSTDTDLDTNLLGGSFNYTLNTDIDKPTSAEIDNPFYKRTVPNLLHDLISYGYTPSAIEFPLNLYFISRRNRLSGAARIGIDLGRTLVVAADTQEGDETDRDDAMNFFEAPDFENAGPDDVKAYTDQPAFIHKRALENSKCNPRHRGDRFSDSRKKHNVYGLFSDSIEPVVKNLESRYYRMYDNELSNLENPIQNYHVVLFNTDFVPTLNETYTFSVRFRLTDGWKVTGGFRKKVNVTNMPTDFDAIGTRLPFDINPFRALIVDNQVNYGDRNINATDTSVVNYKFINTNQNLPGDVGNKIFDFNNAPRNVKNVVKDTTLFVNNNLNVSYANRAYNSDSDWAQYTTDLNTVKDLNIISATTQTGSLSPNFHNGEYAGSSVKTMFFTYTHQDQVVVNAPGDFSYTPSALDETRYQAGGLQVIFVLEKDENVSDTPTITTAESRQIEFHIMEPKLAINNEEYKAGLGYPESVVGTPRYGYTAFSDMDGNNFNEGGFIPVESVQADYELSYQIRLREGHSAGGTQLKRFIGFGGYVQNFWGAGLRDIRKFQEEGDGFTFESNGDYTLDIDIRDSYNNIYSVLQFITVSDIVKPFPSVYGYYSPYQGINIPIEFATDFKENFVSGNEDRYYGLKNQSQTKAWEADNDLDKRPNLGLYVYEDDQGLDFEALLEGALAGLEVVDENNNVIDRGFTNLYTGDIDVQYNNNWIPEVDCRPVENLNDASNATLFKYYDRRYNPVEAEQATAPTTVNFYFYKQLTLGASDSRFGRIWNNYGKVGLKGETGAGQIQDLQDTIGIQTYVTNLDFGDGTQNDELQFRNFPFKMAQDAFITHTYDKPGIYELTGVMFDVYAEDGKVLGYIEDQFYKFTVRFNLLENPELEYDFILNQKPTAVVGGISDFSIYTKSLRLITGYQEGSTDTQAIPLTYQFDTFNAYRASSLINDKYYNAEILEPFMTPIVSSSFVTGDPQGETEPPTANNLTNPVVINDGIFKQTQALGDHLGDTDIGQVRAFTRPKRIFDQLGFTSSVSASATPTDFYYWNNIIPEGYNVKLNRDGITTTNDTNGNLVIEVDPTSNQNWIGGFAYPVLPKVNEQGKLDVEVGLTTGSFTISDTVDNFYGGKVGWNIDDNNSYATQEYITDASLIIDTNLTEIDDGRLYDNSGNDLLNTLITDYKIDISAETRTIQKGASLVNPTKGTDRNQF